MCRFAFLKRDMHFPSSIMYRSVITSVEERNFYLFTRNAKSVLLYGSETWRHSSQISSKPQIFVNKGPDRENLPGMVLD